MPARKLLPSFMGLAIHTTDDLSKLINQGFTGDWVLNKQKAEEKVKLIVMSRLNRGYYFIANIIDVKETKSNGKRKRYIIFFDRPQRGGKNRPELKFNQNPIKYY